MSVLKIGFLARDLTDKLGWNKMKTQRKSFDVFFESLEIYLEFNEFSHLRPRC